MKAKRTRKGKLTRKRKRVQALPFSQPDLDLASKALFGIEEGRGTPVEQDERSVEDPLGDWPESSGESDQWLLERREKTR